jgi:hypothetical protein
LQPIFHLRKVSKDLLQGQVKLAPPPGIVDGEEEYKVEHMEHSTLFRHLLQYPVNSKGYNEKSWELAVIVDELQAIDIFHAEQHGKPGS